MSLLLDFPYVTSFCISKLNQIMKSDRNVLWKLKEGRVSTEWGPKKSIFQNV